MQTLPALLTSVLTGLGAAVFGQAAWDRARVALLVLLCNRIRRMALRLEALFTQFQAGTLPSPRLRPSRAGAAPGAPRTARPDFPGGRAWLLRLAPPSVDPPGWIVSENLHSLRGATNWASRTLGALMSRPDMAEFLQAAPQAGRILRPLWRMVTTAPLPEVLRRPKPRRAPPSRKPTPSSPASAPIRREAPTTTSAQGGNEAPTPHLNFRRPQR